MLLGHLDTLPAEQFETEKRVDAEVELSQISVELGAEFALSSRSATATERRFSPRCGVFMNGRQRVGKLGNHYKFTAYDGVASVPAIAFRCPDIDDLLAHETAVDLVFEARRRRVARQDARPAQRARCRARGSPGSTRRPTSWSRTSSRKADEILAREEYAGIEEAAAFHTKLAGVTFEGRQDALERLTAGTPLRLERQPDNEYDANACALFDPHGDQVGFFNRRLAAALAPAIDAGVEYDVEVTEVTGGDEGRSLGVNVLVSRRDASRAEEDRAEQRAARRAELSGLTAQELDAELTGASSANARCTTPSPKRSHISRRGRARCGDGDRSRQVVDLPSARGANRAPARPRERVRLSAASTRRRPGVPLGGGVRRGRARGPYGDRREQPAGS